MKIHIEIVYNVPLLTGFLFFIFFLLPFTINKHSLEMVKKSVQS